MDPAEPTGDSPARGECVPASFLLGAALLLVLRGELQQVLACSGFCSSMRLAICTHTLRQISTNSGSATR